MAHIHNGINKQTLGRIHSDEEFTVRIRHLMKLKNEGQPLQYYTDSFNRVRVKHGTTWYVIDELWQYIPSLKPEGV